MGGYVTYRLLRDNYGWDKVRYKTVIDEMIMNGFYGWIHKTMVNGNIGNHLDIQLNNKYIQAYLLLILY